VSGTAHSVAGEGTDHLVIQLWNDHNCSLKPASSEDYQQGGGESTPATRTITSQFLECRHRARLVARGTNTRWNVLKLKPHGGPTDFALKAA
jgi:hypothetical protein